MSLSLSPILAAEVETFTSVGVALNRNVGVAVLCSYSLAGQTSRLVGVVSESPFPSISLSLATPTRRLARETKLATASYSACSASVIMLV